MGLSAARPGSCQAHMDGFIKILTDEYMDADGPRRRELGLQIASLITTCKQTMRAAYHS